MSPDQAEHDAWWAFTRAFRDRQWITRGAPSVGAMAKSIIRSRSYQPSEEAQVLHALELYLNSEQLSEREPDLSYFKRSTFDARKYSK